MVSFLGHGKEKIGLGVDYGDHSSPLQSNYSHLSIEATVDRDRYRSWRCLACFTPARQEAKRPALKRI